MGVDMNKIPKEILTKLNNAGYESYIVGGYVRDLLLGIETNDIDICTNAKMKDIMPLFIGKLNEYGSMNLKIGDYNIDITTFREEKDYLDRKPTNIKYIDSLDKDLIRRDFTINTICMDSNGKIIDKLNGINDLNKGVIRMVLDSESKIKEDPLRILRAIRFATVLDFQLDSCLDESITNNSILVKTLSVYRIKEEISKILLSENYIKGLDLLKKYNIDKYLNLSYTNLVYTADVCGMWAQIDYPESLPFTKIEKNNILKLREILELGLINKEVIYNYGLYLSLIAGEILGIDASFIHELYKDMPIYLRNELNISYREITEILNIAPSKLVKDIENDILLKVLNGFIKNTYEDIKEYLINNKDKWL